MIIYGRTRLTATSAACILKMAKACYFYFMFLFSEQHPCHIISVSFVDALVLHVPHGCLKCLAGSSRHFFSAPCVDFDGQHYFSYFWSRTRCMFYGSTPISPRSPHTHNITNDHCANSPQITHHVYKLIDITLCTTCAISCKFDPVLNCFMIHLSVALCFHFSWIVVGSRAPWMSRQMCCVDVSIMVVVASCATLKKLPCMPAIWTPRKSASITLCCCSFT